MQNQDVFPSKHLEKILYCEGEQALAQVAQKGCEVSVLGDSQKLPAHGPGNLVLCGPS